MENTHTSRAAREAEQMARVAGHRSLAAMITTQRKAERREAAAAYQEAERREAERRAIASNARIAAWMGRFDAIRNTTGA